MSMIKKTNSSLSAIKHIASKLARNRLSIKKTSIISGRQSTKYLRWWASKNSYVMNRWWKMIVWISRWSTRWTRRCLTRSTKASALFRFWNRSASFLIICVWTIIQFHSW